MRIFNIHKSQSDRGLKALAASNVSQLNKVIMDTSANVPNIPVWQNTSIKNLPGEVWKVIPKTGGEYLASSLGRIKSLKNGGRKIIKQYGNRSSGQTNSRLSYLKVVLRISGKTVNKYVHRIVVSSFIGKIPKTHHVDHINDDPFDNRICNLRMITVSENTGKAGEKNNKAKLKKSQVKEIIKMRGVISGAEIARKYGVNKETIYHIFNGRTWKGSIK